MSWGWSDDDDDLMASIFCSRTHRPSDCLKDFFHFNINISKQMVSLLLLIEHSAQIVCDDMLSSKVIT